ncbi:MAG: hypothetical protein U1F43_15620 [Myxococcota bacterium]
MKILAIGVLIVTGLGGTALAGEGNPYAKVENGMGNCVFSKTAVLEKGKEADYKLATEFKEGDALHIRCYFPPLGELAKDGKWKNSLREPFGPGMFQVPPYYRAALVWQEGPKVFHTVRVNYEANEDAERTTGRWDVVPGGKPGGDDCDFSLAEEGHRDQCMSLADSTRTVRDWIEKKGHFTTTVCMQLSYEKVQDTRLVNGTEVDVPEEPVFAKSCFKYTIE